MSVVPEHFQCTQCFHFQCLGSPRIFLWLLVPWSCCISFDMLRSTSLNDMVSHPKRPEPSRMKLHLCLSTIPQTWTCSTKNFRFWYWMGVTGQHDILLQYLCGKEYLEVVVAKIEIMPLLGLRSLLSILISATFLYHHNSHSTSFSISKCLVLTAISNQYFE